MNKVLNAFLKFIDNNSCISSCLECMKIRNAREIKSEYRTLYINNLKPDDYNPIGDDNKPFEYCSNRIKTSKYSFWNFLPKNLFEQFRRIANFYFLINAIIIFIIPDPPYSPFTSLVPILFVVIVTAVKQAYEDVLRHKLDREINNQPVNILKNDIFKKSKWQDIKCGDIVKVSADEQLPCDILLLYSKSENENCFVTTVNLDGETNLKQKSIPFGIGPINDEYELQNLRGVIQCEKPNARLYEFKGRIRIHGRDIPISNDNILLRGCTLRVSPEIYGCAIYTGRDTKMMKNTKFKSNKLSCIERKLNRFIVVFLLALAILVFICFGSSYLYDSVSSYWYLTETKPSYFGTNLYRFLILITYTNLFNYIVPLSMYVTIELQRFVGSQFIEWDSGLYDEKNDEIAKANTSDLNEDLGQIEYLFSDKTGTLTENEMVFKQFSIDSCIYHEINGHIYPLNANVKGPPVDITKDEKLFKFFQILSFCHTVQVDKDSNMKEKYQASSPDEFSFIKFCLKLGIVYEGDEKSKEFGKMVRVVNFKNRPNKFVLLDILEFDSTRKRMSVILQDVETKKIVLFCKGAETAILKNCIKGNVQNLDADIKTFAEQGWRTLALAFKYLTEDDYNKTKEMIDTAKNDILNRDEKLALAFDEIESKMELLGATAVEDKLQEDVAFTLESLRRAGIKVWVLTGDKKETAINISHSCKHFSNDMFKLIITDLKTPEEIHNRLEYFKRQMHDKPKFSYALIIDGITLGYLFNTNLDESFRDVCMQCDAVLCCRMSPAQKASVVRLVKKSKTKPLCAAIGDGANDVSMIQEAHVGLGIFGKEGRNAARSADFAFGKFKFARRILLVHGYLYYTRAANLVQYFFYKNLTFAICQFYFSFFSAFSVSSLYDSVILTFYNITFTSAPILLFGLFEQKMSIQMLENDPYIYRTIRRNRTLRAFVFARWNALAIWHSVVSFFFVYAMYGPGSSYSPDGKLGDNYQFGAFIFTSTVLIVHFKLLIEWQYKTVVLLIGYGLSLLSYIVFCICINASIVVKPFTSLTDGQTIYWIYFNLLSNITVWFCISLSIVAALLPDVLIKVFENLWDTRKIDKLKKIESSRTLDDKTNEANGNVISMTDIDSNNKGFEHVSSQPNTLDKRNGLSNRSNKTRVFAAPIDHFENPIEIRSTSTLSVNKISNTKALEEKLKKNLNDNIDFITSSGRTRTNNFSLEEIQ